MEPTIIYERPDGGLSVISIAPNAKLEHESDEAFLNSVKRAIPDGAKFAVVDKSVIPHDREFRDAWTMGINGIEINMKKAVSIKKKALRSEREPLLAALDIDYTKALEKKDEPEMQRIAAEKQRLRDITKLSALASAQTVADLKAITINTKE